MSRSLNPQLAKLTRTYTVDEIAATWNLHPGTVRVWIKSGELATIDCKRPILVHGRDIADLLTARRRSKARPCRPGEIYCVSCRQPTVPAGAMAAYAALSPAHGNLIGICPRCERSIYRRVNLGRLMESAGTLTVTGATAAHKRYGGSLREQ
jgi:hypothetical protein